MSLEFFSSDSLTSVVSLTPSLGSSWPVGSSASSAPLKSEPKPVELRESFTLGDLSSSLHSLLFTSCTSIVCASSFVSSPVDFSCPFSVELGPFSLSSGRVLSVVSVWPCSGDPGPLSFCSRRVLEVVSPCALARELGPLSISSGMVLGRASTLGPFLLCSND